jgi:hypothetical protein
MLFRDLNDNSANTGWAKMEPKATLSRGLADRAVEVARGKNSS